MTSQLLERTVGFVEEGYRDSAVLISISAFKGLQMLKEGEQWPSHPRLCVCESYVPPQKKGRKDWMHGGADSASVRADKLVVCI